MNTKLYQLANHLTPESQTDSAGQWEKLNDAEIKKYSETVLAQIRCADTTGKQTKTKYKAKHRSHKIRYVAAAACTALLLCTTVFSEEVHAAIEHISWSLSSALGLPGDLADYRDIINSSVMDNGYIVTLQEVIAADEKLVVNYTIQREDGQPMGETPMIPFDQLYINGKRQFGGSSGGGGFLDDAHTVVGISRAFDVFDVDMARENTYRLSLDTLEDMESKVRGKWNFSFSADGSELIADTKRIPIEKEFVLEDGITVTLHELTLNELEQRITYHIEGSSDHLLRLDATDSNGTKAEFETKIFQGPTGDGYMQNQEILLDGRIDPSANSITMTLYVTKLPEESGRMNNDYEQIGESFEVQIN